MTHQAGPDRGPAFPRSERKSLVIDYLNRQAVADRLGLSVNTVKWYVREGLMPAPDAFIGVSPGWLPHTIDKWRESQPGKGARTDLAQKPAGGSK